MDTKVYTYGQRIDALRKEKIRQTAEKRKVLGDMDYDDWAIILPPEELRRETVAVSGSGVKIKDIVLNNVQIEENHSCGSFFGAGACGRNFRAVLEAHPVYLDPMSSLGGGYMINFSSYRSLVWNPDYDYAFLEAEHKRYDITIHGIGGTQHLCQENNIALKFGLAGILKKVRHYREANEGKDDEFYGALEDVLIGIIDWIKRTAKEAEKLAGLQEDPNIRKNLSDIAIINYRLLENPPTTFREACQLLLWVQMVLRMYNGSASMGRLDLQLLPYYQKDVEDGILTDEEAIFHISCLLLRDTSFIQLGGYDKYGKDNTNKLSYLVLEAGHRLGIPANIAISVADDIDERLLRRGVEMQLEKKLGYPKFVAIKNMAEGFARNGFSIEDGRLRVNTGCQWHAIPGREYSIMDCIKVNLAKVFEVAFFDMMEDDLNENSTDNLWEKYCLHLGNYIATLKKGIDFHSEHMHKVFPELVMDLFCYGPIEKGSDASYGSLDYYLYGIDAAGLATAADSFAALYENIEKERRLSWQDIDMLIRSNWKGKNGELYRQMMKNSTRYGSGNSAADSFAKKIADFFTSLVANKPTPNGFTTLPGIFGWTSVFQMGENLGATPDGRFAGERISHGANPSPGFRKDAAPTALLKAVSRVQPGLGNSAPAQLDMFPMSLNEENAIDIVVSLVKSHFHDGGTQINLNMMDSEKVIEAYKDPTKYPDLVVRVTGFSAFFISLSPQLRKFIIDRIIVETG